MKLLQALRHLDNAIDFKNLGYNEAWQTLKAYCTQPTDVQQLKAEIAACADDLNTLSRCSCDEAYCIRVINKLRQLSAV